MRTAWPMLLGHLATIIVLVAARVHVTLDNAATLEAAGWLAGSAVWAAGTYAERVKGDTVAAKVVRRIGAFVLSIVPTGPPTYSKP